MLSLLKKNEYETISEEDKKELHEKYRFKLPIELIDAKYELFDNVKTDLELIDNSGTSLYNHILYSNKLPSNKLINLWNKYYTTDKEFLKDYQELLKKYKKNNLLTNNELYDVENILDELDKETGFYEKYKYIDLDIFKNFNKSAIFLQVITIYNLASPVLSLAVPIFMLIMPFIILKIQGINLSINLYIKTIGKLFKNHIIGQIFSKFSEVDMSQKIFMLLSLGFYIFNLYQNIISCYKFYKNIYKIKNYLYKIHNFIDKSIIDIDYINRNCNKSFNKFIDKNNLNKIILLELQLELKKIDFNGIKITHITKIGNILKVFYDLYTEEKYNYSLKYAVDLQYYLNNITIIQKNIKANKLNMCEFTDSKTKFKKSYFVALIENNPIKNSFKLDKQILITGPNAAGKTTILKTALFNIILSQQIGVGCYESASINVYRYIHSYINIPDTSQRDSLFQAEARRCKDILDKIILCNKKDRHFCIFDELYSGTNPSEAIASAFSFLKFLSQYNNIDYILTTHYITLCNMLDKESKIKNYQMEIKNDNSTYKLNNGISNIKGGIKVLEDLNYDDSIIDNAKKIMNNINI